MRIRLLAILALSVFQIASPAWAKGPLEATIDGPGLDQPVGLSYDDPAFTALFEATRFERMVVGGGGSQEALPTHDLGPRYLVTWQLNNDKVAMEVYPFAAGSAVVSVAADQPFHGVVTTGGWTKAGSGLTKILTDLGVSEPAPVTSSAPGPTQPTGLPVMVGVAAAAALTGLLVLRRRAAAR